MSDDGVQAASIQRKKVMTKIIGASRAQEKLLQEILSGLGSETQIQSVYVKPAGDWDSGHPDSVLVDPHIAPTEVVRGEWEAWLIGDAFADRSRAEGLPRVAAMLINGEGGSSLDIGEKSARPESRDPVTAETLAARAKAGVKESGAQLLDLELLQPRHYALVAKLQVDNPADYLSHHARMFLSAIQDPRSARYDGRFIEVVDSKGELAWSDWLAVSEHGRGTSSSYLRPDLSGCDPIPGFGEPAARPPPAPCPADKDQSPSKQ